MLDKLKEEARQDLRQRAEDGSLNQDDADALISLIDVCTKESMVTAVQKLGTTYNKRGITFRKRYELISGKIVYFKRNDSFSFGDGSPANKLIAGDNYYALFNLLVSYRGKVDVIYIDPPYGMDSASRCASTNYRNTYTRDELLSDLYSRLVLAKQLLSKKGVLFCSIDDKNQAYVKCLFDEVFGEDNFVACCPRQTAGSRTTKSKGELQTLHDYLLVYRMPGCEELLRMISGQKTFPYFDERGEYYLVPLQDNGPHGTRTARPNLYYPIYRTKNGDLTLKKTDECFLPNKHKNDDGRWMWSKKKFESDKDDLVIAEGEVKIKHYKKEDEDINKYQAFKTWLSDFRNSSGTKEIADVLEAGAFSNPKPMSLIEWCINLCPRKDALVLDFYAGSGTTGQAVLDLNRQDGGTRQFILCTLNENNMAYDVTARRLKRVMTGSDYDGTDSFPWLEKHEPYGGSLEVLELADVPDASSEVFEAIDETIYGFEKLSVLDKIDWVCNNFDFKIKALMYGGKEDD